MDAAEFTGRVFQKARLAVGRSSANAVHDFHLGDPAGLWPSLPDREIATSELRESVSTEATSIRNGKWLLFGWNEVQVPSPPDWNHDYANGSDAPTDGVETRRLNYRELALGADARCIWETNRWAEMVKLAQNGWLNGVVNDAKLAQRWLFDWHEKNPLGIGINWTSSLEVGLRLINFCWIDALVRGHESADLNSAQDELAQRIVPGHAWWIWRHRSFGSSGNNHVLGELAGLVLATRRWPTLERVSCRAAEAWQLMSTEILRQFADDGGNREQALHYHQFAWEMAWQAQRVIENGPGLVNERLRLAATFFCDLVHDGEPWDFGDSDDAQITPLAFARRTALEEWKAWLLGQEGGAALRFWLGNPPSAILGLAAGRWKIYAMSGLAVQEVNGWKARIDGSPLGFGRLAAHGHLDAMHVSLWEGQRALLIDPGTGAYFGNPEVRRKLASWEMHDGPLPVIGRADPHRMGPFLWVNHHPAPRMDLDGGACTVRFDSAGHVIRRTILYRADDDAWLVTDETGGQQPYVVRWRLAPDWIVASQSATEITVAHRKGGTVKLSVESDELIALEAAEDLVSPHFGEFRLGVALSVTFRGRLGSQWQRVTPSRRT
jgi:hypothetical protein